MIASVLSVMLWWEFSGWGRVSATTVTPSHPGTCHPITSHPVLFLTFVVSRFLKEKCVFVFLAIKLQSHFLLDNSTMYSGEILLVKALSQTLFLLIQPLVYINFIDLCLISVNVNFHIFLQKVSSIAALTCLIMLLQTSVLKIKYM